MTCNEGIVSVLKFRSFSRIDDLFRDMTHDKSDYFVRITGLINALLSIMEYFAVTVSNIPLMQIFAAIYDKICLNFLRFVIISLRDTLPSL